MSTAVACLTIMQTEGVSRPRRRIIRTPSVSILSSGHLYLAWVHVQLFHDIIQIIESRNEISNNVVCATSKGSGQPAHTRSLIRAFASRLNIL